jgi:CPA1 family monovalent cation:H+ antiporter
MIAGLQTLVFLLAAVAFVAFIASRYGAAAPILLVAAGVLIAVAPGVPALVLEPQFVLLLVLPPVIYISAVNMSWREFKFNLRPILLLAVGCVVFTTISVSLATKWLLGWPLAVGFVLGAIVSPPDAVAPLAIARRMQLPRRISVILEGEGLANDATAACPLSLRGGGGQRRLLFAGARRRDLHGDYRRRNRVGHWRRLDDAAAASLHARSAH